VTGAFATFTYDNAGNTTVKAHQGSNPMTFTYDAAYRMTTVQQGTTRSTYTFDDNGNMTREQIGPTSVSTYTYDRENRVTVNNTSGVRETYTNDATGLRRSRNAGGVLTTFVWDGSDYLQERN
jgi:YD repeat-containing protein